MFLSLSEKWQCETKTYFVSIREASEPIQKACAESNKLTKRNTLPYPAHGVKVEGQVMKRAERGRKNLATANKVANISARIAPADQALTFFVQGTIARCVFRVP
jgi:hypothetical protein